LLSVHGFFFFFLFFLFLFFFFFFFFFFLKTLSYGIICFLFLYVQFRIMKRKRMDFSCPHLGGSQESGEKNWGEECLFQDPEKKLRKTGEEYCYKTLGEKLEKSVLLQDSERETREKSVCYKTLREKKLEKNRRRGGGSCYKCFCVTRP
jgi:hypothetical protein